jgi:hypothetical protein
MAGFQSVVNVQPAPAVAGQFASNNPHASVLAGPGGFVAGASGVTVGLFAWVDSTNLLVSNAGSGAPRGIVSNELQASITTWLASNSSLIPAGQPVTLYDQGDFWVVSSTATTIGQKVFASNTTGAVQTGAAGAVIAGYTETKWFVDSIQLAGELVKISTWG